MKSISIASLPSCCCHSPYFSLRQKKLTTTLRLVKTTRAHCTYPSSSSLSTTINSNKLQETQKVTLQNAQNYIFIHQFYSCIGLDDDKNDGPDAQIGSKTQGDEQLSQKISEHRTRKPRGIFTNMWWADLKGALGQSINFEGIVCSVGVFLKDRHLALPHVLVPNIRHIDWCELKRKGFKGVVFDKDNTITAPYSLKLWGPITSSIEQCKSTFGHDIAILSNSAGLQEYDHDGSKAKALEWAVGIKVIRHREKKPAGASEEIEKHFGCDSSQLIMVGDRPFTDIVYGNRNGFFTVLTEPLSLMEEPFIVRQVRKLETYLVHRWLEKGLKPMSHKLLPDPMQCVKDPPPH